jgi:hypothetical protein
MSDLERRLAEDRTLRDAALALFKADLALVRADLDERGIGKRLGDKVGESTLEVIDEAADFAQDNKGKVAAGLAAIILWFARGPILDSLGALLEDDEEEDEEPGRRDSRFRRN